MLDVTLDFETRSPADLKRTGPWKYARHPGTEVLCLAYRIASDRTRLWLPWEHEPDDLLQAVEDGAIFHAHNAFFEQMIWMWVMAARYGWPSLPIERWRCTAAKAAAHCLPRRLERVGEALNLPVRKDDGGHKLMMKMSKPRALLKSEIDQGYAVQLDLSTGLYAKKPLVDGLSVYHDDIDDLRSVGDYCVTDVDVECEVDRRVPDLHPDEQKLWFLDQRINMRGIGVDVGTAEAAIKTVETMSRQGGPRLQALTNGEVEAATQRDRLLNWLRAQPECSDLDVPDLKKETIESLLREPAIQGTRVEEVLHLRQASSKTSISKFAAIVEGHDGDIPRLHSTFLFCGASTGRWSGKGVQPHNFPREGYEPDQIEGLVQDIRKQDPTLLRETYNADPMVVLSRSLRNCLVADPGNTLYVCDFAAIEARVLAWLADETWKLQAFRDFDTVLTYDGKGKPVRLGQDMYVLAWQQIKRLTGMDIEDPKQARQVGKVAELALGYQGGVHAFHSMARNYGVNVPDETANQIKVAWREAHPSVVSWWYDLQDAAMNAVRNPGSAFRAEKVIFFRPEGKRSLYCRLPSGRCLTYPAVCIKKKASPMGLRDALFYRGIHSQSGRWVWVDTYGGKLAENITQAVARDCLVVGMFNLEAAGYPIVMHVHDEAVAETRDDFGSVEEVEHLMCRMPAWADGLPIAAEGFCSKRYRK